MFDSEVLQTVASSALSAADLARWVDRVAEVDTTSSDAELIDQITQLERMKSACAAAQAKLTVAFVTSRTAGLTATEITDERAHRSIAAQVALARHDSPVRGGRHVGLAKALIGEMPHTYASLQCGEISEWRATLLVRETACLSVADRGQVDADLAGKLAGLGDRQTAAAAMRIAQKLDPKAWVARHRKAVSERRVSVRPAADAMGYVSALLPVAKAVAVYAALDRYANSARAIGDDRSRGQLMADEFVSRITHPEVNSHPAPPTARDVPPTSDVAPGPDTSNENPGAETDVKTAETDPSSLPPGVGVEIQLIMTDRTLFDGDNEPATIVGHGPIPAPLARDLVLKAGPQIKAWIRRLFADPVTGHLITADSRRRTFPPALRQFFATRDQVCRTPWCEAPIRHADHLTPHAAGGPTRLSNGRGTCENCNYIKESPGWITTAEPDNIGITITTPTGHTFRSDPPPPPRSAPWIRDSPLEARLRALLSVA